MKKIKHSYKNFFLFILFLVLWGFLISQINSNLISEKISANNAYVIAFFAALLGGVSSFTSSSYIATIVLLSQTSANPFLLALSAGTALTIGDSVFYYFGTHGRKSLPENFKKYFLRVFKWLDKKPKVLIKIFAYFYTGFTPFPTDILMLFISLSKYPLKRIIIPVYIGNISLVLVIYYLVSNGLDFLG